MNTHTGSKFNFCSQMLWLISATVLVLISQETLGANFYAHSLSETSGKDSVSKNLPSHDKVLSRLAELRIQIERAGVTSSPGLASTLSIECDRKLREAREIGVPLETLPGLIGRLRMGLTESNSKSSAETRALEIKERHFAPFQEVAEFEHNNVLGAAQFSADGRLLFTIHDASDGIVVRDVDTEEVVKRLQFAAGPVENFVVSHKDAKILIVHRTSTEVWDLNSGKKLQSVQVTSSTLQAPSPLLTDERIFITRNTNEPIGTVAFWDYNSGRYLGYLDAKFLKVATIVASPDQSKLLTTSDDNVAILWSADTGQVIRILMGHNDKVQTAVFSPDGRFIITSACDKTSIIWDAATGTKLHVLKTEGYSGGMFNATGDRVVTRSISGSASVWDPVTGKLLFKLGKGASGEPVFNHSGDIIATGGLALQLWSAADGHLIQSFDFGKSTSIDSIRFSSDDVSIVASSTYLKDGPHRAKQKFFKRGGSIHEKQ